MASTFVKPKPSAKLGMTKASAAAYRESATSVGDGPPDLDGARPFELAQTREHTVSAPLPDPGVEPPIRVALLRARPGQDQTDGGVVPAHAVERLDDVEPSLALEIGSKKQKREGSLAAAPRHARSRETGRDHLELLGVGAPANVQPASPLAEDVSPRDLLERQQAVAHAQGPVHPARAAIGTRDPIVVPPEVVAQVDGTRGSFAHDQRHAGCVPEPHRMSVHVDQVESLSQAQRPKAHVGNRTRVDDSVEGDLPAHAAGDAGAALVEASRRGVVDTGGWMRPSRRW